MRRIMKWLAVVLAVSGLALVGLTAYRVADPFAGQRQHSLQQQLQHDWKTPARTLRHQPGGAACRYVPARLRPGEPFAMLRIPALGKHWRFAVVEGTALAQLATGPGHVTLITCWPVTLAATPWRIIAVGRAI